MVTTQWELWQLAQNGLSAGGCGDELEKAVHNSTELMGFLQGLNKVRHSRHPGQCLMPAKVPVGICYFVSSRAAPKECC